MTPEEIWKWEIEQEVLKFKQDPVAQQDLKKKLYGGMFLREKGKEEVKQEHIPIRFLRHDEEQCLPE